MKDKKNLIKKNLLVFVENKIKKKKLKVSLTDKKVDLIKDGIIDSIDFLDMISFLEKKLKIKIDISNEKANNFSKIESLSKVIFVNSVKEKWDNLKK